MSGFLEAGRMLDRGRILKLFEELSKELRLQNVRAQIYIVGGAAMSLTFNRGRTTDDVDGRIEKGQHYRVTDAVRTVGRRHGLDDTWLNDQVAGASAEHLLTIKLMAARDADREDIRVLCRHLGLKGPRRKRSESTGSCSRASTSS